MDGLGSLPTPGLRATLALKSDPPPSPPTLACLACRLVQQGLQAEVSHPAVQPEGKALWGCLAERLPERLPGTAGCDDAPLLALCGRGATAAADSLCHAFPTPHLSCRILTTPTCALTCCAATSLPRPLCACLPQSWPTRRVARPSSFVQAGWWVLVGGRRAAGRRHPFPTQQHADGCAPHLPPNRSWLPTARPRRRKPSR